MEDKGDTTIPSEFTGSKRLLALYPFVPGKYGLNLIERTTPFKGRIETGSGRRVKIDIGQRGNKTWVRIDDEDDIDFLMHADLKWEKATISVFSKKTNGEKHPDFFAKQFIAFSLNHFENEGYIVREIEAIWAPEETSEWDSDNYEEYIRSRGEGLDPKEAASKTWSGRTFAELGFTEIEEPLDTGSAITVIFKKPNPTHTGED